MNAGSVRRILALFFAFYATLVLATDSDCSEDVIDWVTQTKCDAEGGDVVSMLKLGDYYDVEQNQPAKAFIWYERAAERDHPLGLFNLANFYEEGIHVPQDLDRAMELYEASARQGFVSAMFNLGNLLCQHHFSTLKVECYFWLRLAADNGDPDALHNLALYIIELDQDLDNGLEYLKVSAEMGHQDSILEALRLGLEID